MLAKPRTHAPQRLGTALAAIAVALCSAATCYPNPAPAVQDDPAAETTQPPEAPDAPSEAEAQGPAEDEQTPDAQPKTPPDPSGATVDQLAESTPEPQPADIYPDMTRALETGMPVSNGTSANPASVLFQVASSLGANPGAPVAIGVDETTGRVVYA